MGFVINKTFIIFSTFVHELSLFLYYTEDAGSHGRTRSHTELQHHPLGRADLAALEDCRRHYRPIGDNLRQFDMGRKRNGTFSGRGVYVREVWGSTPQRPILV